MEKYEVNNELSPEVAEALAEIQRKNVPRLRRRKKRFVNMVTFSFLMPTGIYQRLLSIAEEWHCSIGDLVRHAVIRYIRDLDSGLVTQLAFQQDTKTLSETTQ